MVSCSANWNLGYGIWRQANWLRPRLRCRAMPYRLIYLGLGLVAVAVIALGVVLNRSGEELVLPEQVEALSPRPGDLVPPQASVEIDLPVGYEADIYVDGWLVPDAVFVEATGVYRWAPSAQSLTIT